MRNEAASTPDLDDVLAAIQRDLTVISRRGTVQAQGIVADLSGAGHRILSYIAAHPGCRAADVAAALKSEKSTVSRQLKDLAAAGFIRREVEVNTTTGRGDGLTLTDQGRDAQATVSKALRDALEERLSGWEQDDIQTFAKLLGRYAADAASPNGQH